MTPRRARWWVCTEDKKWFQLAAPEPEMDHFYFSFLSLIHFPIRMTSFCYFPPCSPRVRILGPLLASWFPFWMIPRQFQGKGSLHSNSDHAWKPRKVVTMSILEVDQVTSTATMNRVTQDRKYEVASSYRKSFSNTPFHPGKTLQTHSQLSSRHRRPVLKSTGSKLYLWLCLWARHSSSPGLTSSLEYNRGHTDEPTQ